jgi:hypothetical protein
MVEKISSPRRHADSPSKESNAMEAYRKTETTISPADMMSKFGRVLTFLS